MVFDTFQIVLKIFHFQTTSFYLFAKWFMEIEMGTNRWYGKFRNKKWADSITTGKGVQVRLKISYLSSILHSKIGTPENPFLEHDVGVR